MSKYTAIGGQALIEGIMMRSPEKSALAVRKPDKSIEIVNLDFKSLREKHKILGLPVIRGVVAFAESLVQGYKAMMISAEKSGFTDVEEQKDPSSSEKEAKQKNTDTLLNAVMVIGTVLGVILSVVLFMLVPRLAVKGLEALFATSFSKIVRSGIEQFIKLAVLVDYK